MSSNKFRYFSALSTLVFLLLGCPNLFASAGVGAGGGGDTRCQEFYGIASELSIDLVKIGQATVNQTDPLIQVETVRSLVKNVYRVVPGTPAQLQGREAWTDADAKITYLDVDQWQGKSRLLKYKFVSHELMVLSTAESDGEYLVSADLIKILSSTRFGLIFKSDGSLTNPDGSITITVPRYVIDGAVRDMLIYSSPESLQGTCKYLGFNQYTGESVPANEGSSTIYCYANLDKNGSLRGEKCNPNSGQPDVDYVQYLNCK